MTRPLIAKRSCALFALAPCALLAACASAPSVEVLSAELIEVTDQGSVVAFTIAADNKSADALPLRYVQYSATAGGLAFTGERAGEATLRSSGVQFVVIPASFPGRVSVGESADVRGSIGYVNPGPLAAELYDMGLYRPSVAFLGQAVVEAARPKPPDIRTTPVLKQPGAADKPAAQPPK